MFVVAITACIVAVGARVYDKCELARDLTQLGVQREDLATWVCIAYHESRLDTAAHNPGSGDHGLLQISQLYWCGNGKACGLPCSSLRDDDISDDVECALQVHEEHTRLQGDGFLAWVVYPQHCKHNVKKYLIECSEDGKNTSIRTPEKSRSFTLSNNTNIELNSKIDELRAPYLIVNDIYRNSIHKSDSPARNLISTLSYPKFDNINELKIPHWNLENPTTKYFSTTTSKPDYLPKLNDKTRLQDIKTRMYKPTFPVSKALFSEITTKINLPSTRVTYKNHYFDRTTVLPTSEYPPRLNEKTRIQDVNTQIYKPTTIPEVRESKTLFSETTTNRNAASTRVPYENKYFERTTVLSSSEYPLKLNNITRLQDIEKRIFKPTFPVSKEFYSTKINLPSTRAPYKNHYYERKTVFPTSESPSKLNEKTRIQDIRTRINKPTTLPDVRDSKFFSEITTKRSSASTRDPYENQYFERTADLSSIEYRPKLNDKTRLEDVKTRIYKSTIYSEITTKRDIKLPSTRVPYKSHYFERTTALPPSVQKKLAQTSTEQSIYDLYLNTRRPTLSTYSFAPFTGKHFKVKIFSEGSTTPRYLVRELDQKAPSGGATRNHFKRYSPT